MKPSGKGCYLRHVDGPQAVKNASSLCSKIRLDDISDELMLPRRLNRVEDYVAEIDSIWLPGR